MSKFSCNIALTWTTEWSGQVKTIAVPAVLLTDVEAIDFTALNNKTTICLNFLPSPAMIVLSPKLHSVQSVHAVYCSNDKSVSDNPAYQLHWTEPDLQLFFPPNWFYS